MVLTIFLLESQLSGECRATGTHSLGHIAVDEGLPPPCPQRRPHRVCAIYLRSRTLSEPSAGPTAALQWLT